MHGVSGWYYLWVRRCLTSELEEKKDEKKEDEDEDEEEEEEKNASSADVPWRLHLACRGSEEERRERR